MKKSIVLWGILLAAAMLYGLWGRTTHTDLLKEQGIEAFQVALLRPEVAREDTMELIRTSLPDAPYILRVKASGQREYLPHSITQRVTVEQVYQGDGLQEGEELDILGTYRFFIFGEDALEAVNAMNMGFVNFMEKDHEYLIFLSEEKETIQKSHVRVFELVPYIISPVFDYEVRDSNVMSALNFHRSIPYGEIEDNEFFVNSKYVLAQMQDMKREFLEQYPKEK